MYSFFDMVLHNMPAVFSESQLTRDIEERKTHEKDMLP